MPFGLGGITDAERSVRWTLVGLGTANVLATIGCALKREIWVALIGTLVPLVGFVGAVRLARPASPWARSRYTSRPARAARAGRRDVRWERRRRQVYDLVAGAPTTGT